MKIGLVCPYSLDTFGGVQAHVLDLAKELQRRNHKVQVLAPASEECELPDWVTSAGDSIAIPYNGSVARLSFGAGTVIRARRWLENGNFDLVHIHEPLAPSVGMIVLQAAQVPVVATFHSAMDKSLARELLSPATAPLLERVNARIAVSQEARRTLVHFHGGDAVVIPNGVNVAPFMRAPHHDPRFVGSANRPSIAFLGRLDEPRKGLPILAGAVPSILQTFPHARFFIAGRGDGEQVREYLARFSENVTFLGEISQQDKAALLASATIYVAPQTGGESFGIVLVEAMAAGTQVVASDLTAFSDVLGQGRYGALFRNGDCDHLAQVIIDTLTNTTAARKRKQAADAIVERYDWKNVTNAIVDVYDMALSAAHAPVSTTCSTQKTILGKIRAVFEGAAK